MAPAFRIVWIQIVAVTHAASLGGSCSAPTSMPAAAAPAAGWIARTPTSWPPSSGTSNSCCRAADLVAAGGQRSDRVPQQGEDGGHRHGGRPGARDPQPGGRRRRPAGLPTAHRRSPGSAARCSPASSRSAALAPYDLASRRGELKHLLVTESPDGELMVRFVVRSQEPVTRLRKHLPALRASLPRCVVASVNLQPEHKAVLEGEREILLTEQETLRMRVDDLDLHLRPQSFFQTNTAMAAALYRQARDWVTDAGPASVWDLYCGVGGFALTVAPVVGEVPGSRSARRRSPVPSRPAMMLGLPGVRFVAGDATAYALADGAAPELVIVNPPRRGIGAELSGWLERSEVRHVLYSSCNAESPGSRPDRDAVAAPGSGPVVRHVRQHQPLRGADAAGAPVSDGTWSAPERLEEDRRRTTARLAVPPRRPPRLRGRLAGHQRRRRARPGGHHDRVRALPGGGPGPTGRGAPRRDRGLLSDGWTRAPTASARPAVARSPRSAWPSDRPRPPASGAPDTLAPWNSELLDGPAVTSPWWASAPGSSAPTGARSPRRTRSPSSRPRSTPGSPSSTPPTSTATAAASRSSAPSCAATPG